VFVSTSIREVSSEENTLSKLSEDLQVTLDTLSSDDQLLLWLDVYVQPLADGNIYLHSSDLSLITDVGARIAGVTFSPNGQLFWYLVEARTEQVSSLANLPIVQKISLASTGVWDWWARN
jgi:hypothetical protein